MRNVITYKPGEQREYIPKAYGNNDDKTPVKLWIKQPSEGERRRLLAGLPVNVTVDSQGNHQTQVSQEHTDWAIKAIESFVVKVENYIYGEVPITDGKTLCEFGEQEFLNDAVLEIMQSVSLGEQDKKK